MRHYQTHFNWVNQDFINSRKNQVYFWSVSSEWFTRQLTRQFSYSILTCTLTHFCAYIICRIKNAWSELLSQKGQSGIVDISDIISPMVYSDISVETHPYLYLRPIPTYVGDLIGYGHFKILWIIANHWQWNWKFRQGSRQTCPLLAP